eukprot:TRINITY_DN29244_c0_g1_i2.p1 TRINITY_DN29244_c0_g1~~TRINITY_DN29244_c0_g1_i2.p1  ORF type:complete len:205 (+),score=14.01 TRINITY_DN29244_c0_g1_i2:369-983(+)
MDSGIPYCCRLEELFLVEMVRVGSAAVSDECIGRLLTSIGNSNNGISAYSPLRSLKIVGFAALGDLTLKALTHANLPFLSSVTLFTSDTVGFTMSEESLLHLIKLRRFGLIRNLKISCEHERDDGSAVEFTPAVAKAWVDQVITEECVATTSTITTQADNDASSTTPTTTTSPVCVLSLIHISEPTRLLSISYAVFCLKKKKNP